MHQLIAESHLASLISSTDAQNTANGLGVVIPRVKFARQVVQWQTLDSLDRAQPLVLREAMNGDSVPLEEFVVELKDLGLI